MSLVKKPWHRANEPGITTPYVKQIHINRYVKQIPHMWAPSFKNKSQRFLPERLPCAESYYRQQFPLKVVEKVSWVSVPCCFHEDRHPSLRIHLDSGAFRCFSCGAKGRHIVIFHQQRYNMTFQAAAQYLGAWGEA